MYFCVNEFEVGVNDSIFSGNEQHEVSLQLIFLFNLLNYVITKNNRRKH